MNSKQRGSGLLWRAVWGVREENGVGEKETRVGTSPRGRESGDQPKTGEGGWICPVDQPKVMGHWGPPQGWRRWIGLQMTFVVEMDRLC